MTQVYIPAALVVIISWVPFWLNRDSQARVALGVTTVLTMTTLTTTLNTDFPKISHVTALDVYLFVCFTQVFLSLIEYATIGYFDEKKQRLEERQNIEYGEREKKKPDPLIKDTSVIDYWARRIFPLSFLLFVFFYAVVLYYIKLQNEHAKVQVKLS